MSYGPPPGGAGQYYGGSPQPPPQGYGGPPPGQQGYPPQQGYGAPPHQQQYNRPPPPQNYPPQGPPQGFPPQQQNWGPPPQQPQYGQNYGPPPMPSPGYDPRQVAQGDASRDADALRSAMKGFGTDEKTLYRVLSKPDPLQMALLRNTFQQRYNRDLEKDIHSETSKYFRDTLEALVRGPLVQDCHLVQFAIKGLGTKESLLNDVLLGRSNADMRAIKHTYQQLYHHSLEKDVGDDLSLKTKQLFNMVMAANRAEENSPVNPQMVERDVADIHHATHGNVDQVNVCSILSSRSDGQIRAIAQAFQQRYQSSLEDVLKRKFDGHMEDALVLMVRRATDRAMCDAVQLEDAMAGMGTRDILLLNRVVRVHWDRQHMDQVKRAYHHRYHRDVLERIRGEIHTQGDYRETLVACLS